MLNQTYSTPLRFVPWDGNPDHPHIYYVQNGVNQTVEPDGTVDEDGDVATTHRTSYGYRINFPPLITDDNGPAPGPMNLFLPLHETGHAIVNAFRLCLSYNRFQTRRQQAQANNRNLRSLALPRRNSSIG